MSEEQKQGAPAPESEQPKNHPKTQSIFDTVREVDLRERREAERKERERQRQQAEEDYQAREQYGKQLDENKRELMRLKHGVIEQSETIYEEQPQQRKYSWKERISNFFYHNKWWLGIAVVFGSLAGFLIYDTVTQVKPDVVLMMVTEDYEMSLRTEEICTLMEAYMTDLNGDGKITADIYYIPANPETLQSASDYNQGNSSKLIVQLQSATAVLVMSDPVSDESIRADAILEDLSLRYPDNPQVEGYRFYLGDAFLEAIGYEGSCNEGLYLGIRTPKETFDSIEKMEENYNAALPVLEGFVEQFTESDS